MIIYFAYPFDLTAKQCAGILNQISIEKFGSSVLHSNQAELIRWLEENIPCKIENCGTENMPNIKSMEVKDEDYLLFVLKYT
jgi:hypothetical protein